MKMELNKETDYQATMDLYEELRHNRINLNKALFLINRGADINVTNAGGESLLEVACKDRNVSVVKKLIEQGIDVSTYGGPALCAAIERTPREEGVFEVLIKAGADVNYANDGITIVHRMFISPQSRDCSLLGTMIDTGRLDLTLKNSAGNTALQSGRQHLEKGTHGSESEKIYIAKNMVKLLQCELERLASGEREEQVSTVFGR